MTVTRCSSQLFSHKLLAKLRNSRPSACSERSAVSFLNPIRIKQNQQVAEGIRTDGNEGIRKASGQTEMTLMETAPPWGNSGTGNSGEVSWTDH